MLLFLVAAAIIQDLKCIAVQTQLYQTVEVTLSPMVLYEILLAIGHIYTSINIHTLDILDASDCSIRVMAIGAPYISIVTVMMAFILATSLIAMETIFTWTLDSMSNRITVSVTYPGRERSISCCLLMMALISPCRPFIHIQYEL